MNRIEQLEDNVRRLQSRLTDLERGDVQTSAPSTSAAATPLGAVYNRLRNGDISLSENHYNDVAPSGANDEREAAHFYTHAAGTTALIEGAAQAVSSFGHTVNNPAGNADPAWDKTNGFLQWGSNQSIDCPLPGTPHKVGEPSKIVYVLFLARKKNSTITIPAGLRVGIGLHDNTAGQRKYLTGGQLTLTAGVVGAPAGTTSRNYKVIATTDWGETYESNEVTVPFAPNNASYITNQVYVRLDWTPVIGVTRYDIYRLTGATYVLAGQIFNGTAGFNEQNNFLRVEAGYPVTSGTNARAYVEVALESLTTEWKAFDLAIPVPQTYDASVTTDKQWLRLTLSQALAAGSERGIELDKLSVSWNFGNWAPAPEDAFAKQGSDTSPVSGSQGLIGTGGAFDEPEIGRGRERFITVF